MGLSHTDTRGFSVVEVLLASSLFVLFVTVLVGAFLYGEESAALAGNRARAVMLADEGIEAVRNIRDAGYANLANGTYGLATTSNYWILAGSSDASSGFSRQVTVSTIDANRKEVSSTVSWQQNAQRSGSVTITTRLTNWRATQPPATSCNDYAVQEGYSSATCRQNAQQCANNSEINIPGGNAICVLNFPGDPSRDTCCALP